MPSRKAPKVTVDTPIGPGVDLEQDDVRLADGMRLTDDVAEGIVDEVRRAAGRPSLSGSRQRSPADPALLSNIRAARQRLRRDGPSSVRREGDFDRVTLPAFDADVLCELLLAERPRVVIEIGLAYGSSALAIAEALVCGGREGASHLIVDAFQEEFEDAGWNAVVAAGLDHICALRRQRSQRVLPELLADGVTADAAFVDGSHIFHNVFVDLYFLRELVRPGGLIVLDDCEWPSVAVAVDYFVRNTGWQAERIGRATRLRAFRLPDPKVEPNFEEFKPFGVRSPQC